MNCTTTYDVIVVGAGHAGVEAGLAAARMGRRTLLLTLSLDNIAMMPCNPSVGGPGKSHLVREIDALGGQMGIAADRASIQRRLLNTGKGPAVHALRMQSDKFLYQRIMKESVENTENLDVRQLLVTALITEENAGGKRVTGVRCETGECLTAHAVILATRTHHPRRDHLRQRAERTAPGDGALGRPAGDRAEADAVQDGNARTHRPPHD